MSDTLGVANFADTLSVWEDMEERTLSLALKRTARLYFFVALAGALALWTLTVQVSRGLIVFLRVRGERIDACLMPVLPRPDSKFVAEPGEPVRWIAPSRYSVQQLAGKSVTFRLEGRRRRKIVIDVPSWLANAHYIPLGKQVKVPHDFNESGGERKAIVGRECWFDDEVDRIVDVFLPNFFFCGGQRALLRRVVCCRVRHNELQRVCSLPKLLDIITREALFGIGRIAYLLLIALISVASAGKICDGPAMVYLLSTALILAVLKVVHGTLNLATRRIAWTSVMCMRRSNRWLNDWRRHKVTGRSSVWDSCPLYVPPRKGHGHRLYVGARRDAHQGPPRQPPQGSGGGVGDDSGDSSAVAAQASAVVVETAKTTTTMVNQKAKQKASSLSPSSPSMAGTLSIDALDSSWSSAAGGSSATVAHGAAAAAGGPALQQPATKRATTNGNGTPLPPPPPASAADPFTTTTTTKSSSKLRQTSTLRRIKNALAKTRLVNLAKFVRLFVGKKGHVIAGSLIAGTIFCLGVLSPLVGIVSVALQLASATYICEIRGEFQLHLTLLFAVSFDLLLTPAYWFYLRARHPVFHTGGGGATCCGGALRRPGGGGGRGGGPLGRTRRSQNQKNSSADGAPMSEIFGNGFLGRETNYFQNEPFNHPDFDRSRSEHVHRLKQRVVVQLIVLPPMMMAGEDAEELSNE